MFCAATSALAAVLGFMAHGLWQQEDVNIDLREILGVKDGNGTVQAEAQEETTEELEEGSL